jgi:hypothetical protein
MTGYVCPNGFSMIDKLDVRIPSMTAFAPEMAAVAADLRGGSIGPFRASRFYKYVADLRKSHGIDAIVHLEYKFGECTHKVEVIDAGKKTLAEMEQIVSRIFAINPSRVELMRVDLAADVPGVPVVWFRDNASFSYKRFASRIEKAKETELEFIGMSQAEAQSLYAGRKPNCVRIYDKFAELKLQWSKVARNYKRFNKGMDNFELSDEQRYYGERIPLPFEQFCREEGHEYAEGAMLTRVERQIGGDRFPDELRTVADLRHAADFNPFSGIQLLAAETARESNPPTSGSMRDWLAARGFQTLIDEKGGMQSAASFVLKYGNGNGRRLLESIMPHMPKKQAPITGERLYELYKHSTLPQMAA